MDSVRRAVGKNIRFYRIRIDMAQLELAYRLGYDSTGMMSLIENGKRGMGIEKIPEVCKILGITPNDLFDENPKRPDFPRQIGFGFDEKLRDELH